ncbi:MAG: DUF1573 domain-containing protein [Gemmataceae bacterium]
MVNHEAGEHPSDLTVTRSPFQFRNQSDRPVRVLGFTTVCIPSCCARVDLPGPVVIQPGETAAFVAEFKVATPGPFEAPIDVYYDDGSLRTMPITLAGVGRPTP